MSPVAVVTISGADLDRLIEAAVMRGIVAAQQRVTDKIERFSASKAARKVKKRTSLILAAAESGALPAHFQGRSWSIRGEDLDKWVDAGCPLVKP